MRPARNIEKIIKKFDVDVNPGKDKKIFDELQKAQAKSKMPRLSFFVIDLWRIIMKSKITKFATAAVIIISVLIGINHFGGSIDGTSVVWADVIKNIDQVKDYIYRQRQTDYSGIKPSGIEFTSEWETIWYYSSEFGIRYDHYKSDKLISQFYSLLKDQQRISISPMQKTFSCSDDDLPQTMSVDPRSHILQIIDLPHTKLGTQVIDGITAEGIEVNGQKVSGPYLVDVVSRLWVDVQTQLPVRLESQGKQFGSDMFALLVQDQFQWNVNLTKADFTPVIPEDFTHEIKSHIDDEKWDQVVAEYTQRDTTVDFGRLEQLGLLYNDQDFEKPSRTLTGIREIRDACDQMIRSWPKYADLREPLQEELDDKLDMGLMSVEELVTLGVLLREKFWDAGGSYSPVSYKYGYMSRILLELAYAQCPDDLVIGDELAEAIMAAGTIRATDGFAEVLLDIRLNQLRQIRKEVEDGRQPNWNDFTRGCDVAYLAAVRRPDEAAAAVDWLIQNADNGRWKSCLEKLLWMRPLVAEGTAVGFQIYYYIKPGFPEEFSFGGRAPSFKGARSRIVIPIPEMKEPPPSDDQP
jgi:hypothetical protein